MKTFLAAAAAALLLAACASDTSMTADQVNDHAACRRTDAPTGSNLVRKSDCAPQRAAAAPASATRN